MAEVETPPDDTIICGIDEAGRGPVIGPMVIAIVCASTTDMRRIGARDSKTLSPSSREKLFTSITKESTFYRFTIISATEINGMMDRMTLNEIEENGYSALINSAPGDYPVYVDSFDVDPHRLSARLSGITGRNVICRHKADAIYPVVSASSIVAKVIRDREINRLAQMYGDFGSGYPSDERTIRFLESAARERRDMTGIARTHWETYRRIMENSRRSKLF